MKKYLLGLTLLYFIFIGCEETTSISGTNDNATNNYPESVKIMKQVDSLFQAVNVQQPDDWDLKQVRYSSEYSDDSLWSKKKINSILYLSHDGDFDKSIGISNYAKFVPINRPKIKYFKNNMIALILAQHLLGIVDGSDNLTFHHSYSTFEYNSSNKITKIYYTEYMTGVLTPMTDFFYTNDRLIRSEDMMPDNSVYTTTYSYGNNGFINRIIRALSDQGNPDTSYYEQNSNGYLSLERTVEFISDTERGESKKEYVYSSNKIIVNSFSSAELNQPDNVRTYTYRDNQYQTLISHEDVSGYSSGKTVYEYSNNTITERNYSGNTLSYTIEYILDSQDRISEELYSGGDGVPISKTIYEYYNR
ncbi:MAG: hypothetical protein KAH48_00775 [Chlorobi bacterium]|nr:hypothetical protein [Chlorobiota bacterium]